MWTELISGEDGSTSTKFGPEQIIAASYWNSQIWFIDANKNTLASKITMRAPALSIDWGQGSSATHLFSGGAEMHPSVYDLGSQKSWDFGSDHESPISSICAVEPTVVLSGGLDGKIQIADTRSDEGIFYQLKNKIIDMSASDKYLAVAMADKLVSLYDIRRLSEPIVTKQMYFKEPIKTIKMFPDNDRFAVSSVKSRVAVECMSCALLDFAFRAHRSSSQGYMINALACATTPDQYLYTGGSDGKVHVWDCLERMSVHELPQLPLAVFQLDFSRDGSLLAASCCDDTFTRNLPASQSNLAQKLFIARVGPDGVAA